MALDEVGGKDAGVGFNVVDVLGVVCEELGFVLEEADEGVGGGEGGGRGQDGGGDRVEDRGVFAEDGDIKDFLRVGKAEVLEL